MRRPRRLTLTGLLAYALAALTATSALAGTSDDLRPRLESARAGASETTFRAIGFDPAAPRALVLWRWNGRRFLRGARTRSVASGRFDFGEQPIPTRDAAFHVAAEGETPSSDSLVWLERPVPAPVVLSGGLDSGEIALAPARYEGVIRVTEADTGRLLERLPVESSARATRAVRIDTLAWPAALRAVLIEQILDDGRRSRAVFVALPQSVD